MSLAALWHVGSSQTRNGTCVTFTDRQSPTHWTTREVWKRRFGITELGAVLEEGNGNPLQYSCLENPMDGEAW